MSSNMMIDRIFILGLVTLAVLAAWGLAQLWKARAVRRMQSSSPFGTLIAPGRPAVVSFSSPTCAECRSLQAPALTRLGAQLGERVAIVRLSAPEHPELIDQVGILTVPATVVLDRQGVVRHLNLGFADSERLEQQIRACETA
jgi:thiol-disulfide isomerase/thioredoxin